MSEHQTAADKSNFKLRIALGVIGVLGILYGLRLLFKQPLVNHPWQVVKWGIGADIVTDGVIIPVIIAVGWLLRRLPTRVRRYLQGALIVGGSATLIALPLIHRRGIQRPGQALLQQDYRSNLVILLAVVAVVAALLYARRVLLDQRSRATNVRPETDQTSPTV